MVVGQVRGQSEIWRSGRQVSVPRNESRVGLTYGDPDQKVSGTCDIGLGDVSMCQGLEW